MPKASILKSIAIATLATASAQAQITGEVRYHRQLAGEGLRPRDVIVWLPASYASETNRHYPVLYMHDGQNIIDPATSFLGVDWGIDETVTRLAAEKKIPELIVVGAYNTADRTDEYGANPELTRRYMDFVVGPLKSLIDAHYRTLPDREHTAVMGSSMGGLISFLLAWEHPDVFFGAGCVSPAFTVGNWVDEVAAHDGPAKPIRLYLDNGEKGLEAELQKGCDRMLDVLPRKGFEMGKNLDWFKDAGAEHNEPAWAARVWRPLEFLFGDAK